MLINRRRHLSMEKLMVEAYDMECMKMALLKHEATFKQQVYELHRLYEIQRMLMKKMMHDIIINEESLKNGNRRYDEKQLNNYDLQKQYDHYAYINVNDGDENEDDNNDEMEEESEIELTLGPATKKKKKKSLKSSSSAGLGMFSASSSSSTDHKTRLVTLHNNSIHESRSTACT